MSFNLTKNKILINYIYNNKNKNFSMTGWVLVGVGTSACNE